jgi:hypothetical protein
MARRRAWIGLGLVLAIGLSSGCSFILDFDGDLTDAGPAPDSALPDVDPLAPDAPPDPAMIYEPNDSQQTAKAIVAGTTYGPIAIQPIGDHDFFSFTLDAPHDVTIDCTFVTSEGDLDLRLWDATMTKIGESAGFMDNEHIIKTTAMGGQLGAGTYVVEVYGFNNQRTNDHYALLVTVQ